RYIVGLAGPPGAGKSTVASEVVRRVNMRWSQKHAKDSSLNSNEDIATMLPMDGFHLYRSQLDAMEDPKEAHARRGAPWTFNPSLFLKCLQTLKEEVFTNFSLSNYMNSVAVNTSGLTSWFIGVSLCSII
uniref:Phosphoribulokinase/uridine kinase domain-containing protein n=1 Tax=Aegilops tauschii subsp. strangulata TaxID=200361 RepID=A0A453JRM6_AEGTS